MRTIATALAALTGIIALESGAVWADTAVSRDADVRDCELYLDDLSVQSSGAYGNWRTELVGNLVARGGLKLVEVGGYFRYRETSMVKEYDQAGNLINTRREEGVHQQLVLAVPSSDGRYGVTLRTNWSVFLRDVGDRELLNFAFYVVAAPAGGGEATRFWLKNGGMDFASADISPDRYYYSQGVFLGGYTTAKYLWRDSGSPVFHNRQGCLGR